jgi:dihydrofolate reductase
MRIDGLSIEGFAIVSADGCIAEADGTMPTALMNEADWRYYQTALDRSAVVVLGRLGHERHPNPGRRRLVLTRGVAALEPCPRDPKAALWNPVGMPVDLALRAIGVRQGMVAVTGGTGTYDTFLPIGFDAFHLAWAPRVRIPDGRPCFSGIGPGRAVADVLRDGGLEAGPIRVLDPRDGILLSVWTRAGDPVPLAPEAG